MKKTFVVCVNHNKSAYGQVGDVWYGPFVKEAAESLEEKLSNIFLADSGSSTNRPVAWVLPLTNLTIKEVLAQYRKELLESE